MTPRILSLASAATIVFATQASAQQAPAAGAAPAPNPLAQAFTSLQASPPGPVVSGLCVLSRDGVIARSTVGQYAAGELQKIEQAANAELTTARTAAETNVRTLQQQRTAGTLNDQAYAAQANQISAQLEQLLNIRVAEVRETDSRVQARIMAEATPLIMESISAKRCSALFDAQALIYRGDAYDITSDVVTRLNAKVTSFPIQRVQAQTAPAAGAPPVATTPPAGGRGAAGPTR